MNKTLVIMCDSRPLSTDIATADYHALVAYINFSYCKKNGYDFIFYNYSFTFIQKLKAFISILRPRLCFYFFRELVKGIKSKLPISFKIKPSCFNVSLGQYRASPWGKLLVLHEALKKGYNRTVYIDSDCAFVDHEKSLDVFERETKALFGQGFENSHIGLLKDFPFNNELPCSGFIVAKNTPETKELLKTWWNLDNSKFNFSHPYEQSSIVKLFPSLRSKICLWDALFLVEEKGQYLRHIASFEGHLRSVYFGDYARRLEKESGMSFKDGIEAIDCKVLAPLSW